MEADLPARPLIGPAAPRIPALRAGHRLALRGAGFDNLRPAHANVFARAAGGSPSRNSLSLPACASRPWPRRSSNSSTWATYSAAQTRATAGRGWCSSPSEANPSGRSRARHRRASRGALGGVDEPEELEALRASLLRLLMQLRASIVRRTQTGTSGGSTLSSRITAGYRGQMKAIVQVRYGAPERVLKLDDLDRPSAGDDDVLIRVRATSEHFPDWITVTGSRTSFGSKSGLRRRGRRCGKPTSPGSWRPSART